MLDRRVSLVISRLRSILAEQKVCGCRSTKEAAHVVKRRAGQTVHRKSVAAGRRRAAGCAHSMDSTRACTAHASHRVRFTRLPCHMRGGTDLPAPSQPTHAHLPATAAALHNHIDHMASATWKRTCHGILGQERRGVSEPHHIRVRHHPVEAPVDHRVHEKDLQEETACYCSKGSRSVATSLITPATCQVDDHGFPTESSRPDTGSQQH